MSSPTYGSMVIAGETITWRELPRQEIGVNFNEPTTRREWLFSGSLNSDSIQQAASIIVPALDVRFGVTRFFERYDFKEHGGGVWSVPVQYRSKPAYWDMSLDTSGGRAKMLQSYATTRGYDCTGSVIGEDPTAWQTNGAIPDFGKAIGVNGNNVTGVDIEIPKFDFSVNFKFQMSTLSASYLMTLYNLTGKANNATYTLAWKGQSVTFAMGDLRFLGAAGKQTSDDQVDLTFKFSAMKGLAGGTISTASMTQPTVGGTATVDVDSVTLFSVSQQIYISGTGTFFISAITGNTLHIVSIADPRNLPPGAIIPAGVAISADSADSSPLVIAGSKPIKKLGWEYLWIYYEESTDPATQRVVRKPIGAYIEQVVKYGDFSQLGI